MYYSLPLVGIDIQSHHTKALKIKFEEFIKEFSDKKTVDITASDIFRKARSDSISISDIEFAYQDLENFIDQEGLGNEQTLWGLVSSKSESKHEPHIFWCQIDVAILVLHFLERINYEN
jgi:hypothetical protein